ncbi:alpha/beta fold hydrolase [Roseovarius sp.]|uniref:alpha/beta fold hydrolase n=1 Tax=Roseovarius sp. TaxID=1486281 RepID=UPI003B59AAD3
MSWNLAHTADTPAGPVAWGSAGSGPPLVLAHGWPWSSVSWHRLIPALAETHSVHWYDMPGYGRSEKRADQPTGLDVQGQVFAHMLTHWGLNRPHVVAHDFGGATSLRAHLLHGAEFDRLVLMNVVAMRPWGSDFFDHVGRHVDALTGLPPHIHEAIVRAYIDDALVTGLGSEDTEALVAPWLDEAGRASFYRQFAQADECFTAEIEPRYGAVRCSVTIVWGEADPWIPLDRGRALHGLIPGSDFKTLPGVGHLPQLEAPEAVLRALSGVLDG